MGYTHYWQRPFEIEPLRYAAIVRDVRALIKRLPATSESAGGYHRDAPLVVCGYWGEGKPHVTGANIMLNGEAARDMACGTLLFPRVLRGMARDWAMPREDGRYGSFVKTERLPYDLLVCAALLVIKQHVPQVSVQTDGNFTDWEPAIAFYRSVFPGRQAVANGEIVSYDSRQTPFDANGPAPVRPDWE